MKDDFEREWSRLEAYSLAYILIYALFGYYPLIILHLSFPFFRASLLTPLLLLSCSNYFVTITPGGPSRHEGVLTTIYSSLHFCFFLLIHLSFSSVVFSSCSFMSVVDLSHAWVPVYCGPACICEKSLLIWVHFSWQQLCSHLVAFFFFPSVLTSKLPGKYMPLLTSDTEL